ncbi:MAG: flp pilus-assembly TadE/G-like family protein [Promicromonosporaceae bacterium]|nr:flp pilus-assembly TadE/G-like family protein [Promicromonosporaceae bacterium]
MKTRDPEAGSGTILALMVVFVAFVAGVALIGLGTARHTRWQAQTAADFGALAGASALRTGFEACAVAAAATARNQGSLVNCEILSLGRVRVDAVVPMRWLPGWQAVGSALAGPRPP